MTILTWNVDFKDAKACKNAGANWNPILQKCITPKKITHDGKLFKLNSSPLKKWSAGDVANSYKKEGKQTYIKSFDKASYFVYMREQ